MATRKITRKIQANPARTARRAVTPSTSVDRADTPQFTRVRASLDLVPPPGFLASAILRLVARAEGRRIYALWLAVGRHDDEALTVRYKFKGEDAVRCDIPSGNFLSAAKLEPFLKRFLKDEGKLDPDPPTIKR